MNTTLILRGAGDHMAGAGQRWAPETPDAFQRIWIDQEGPYIKRDAQGVPLDPSQAYQGFPSMAQLAGLGMPAQALPGKRKGSFGSADRVTRIETAVAVVVHALHAHGSTAGLREAARWGLVDGAKLYIDIRAETEEQLSARLAKLQAAVTRHPKNNSLIAKRAFVALRLQEVRAAIKSGHSAPQAIADRPEIPRREVPRWVSFAALGASGLAIIISLMGRSR